MKFNRSLAVMAVIASASLISSPAAAQVRVGQNIQMTTAQGLVARGKVMSLSADEMDFKGADGHRSKVALGGVRQIQVVDSKANGLIGGALAGGAIVAAFHFGSFYSGFFPAAYLTQIYGSNLKTGVIGGAIIGGLIGMAIDSSKMTTVYQRTDRMSLEVRPIVSNAGKGIGVRLRW